MKYLEKGAKNAKMVPGQIQNDIIECLSEFVRLKIKDGIPEYYTSIVDDVTDRFSIKEILLLYYFTSLRYVKCCTNEKSYICETCFDSLHIQGRPIGQTVENSISMLLQKMEETYLNFVFKHMMAHLQWVVKH